MWSYYGMQSSQVNNHIMNMTMSHNTRIGRLQVMPLQKKKDRQTIDWMHDSRLVGNGARGRRKREQHIGHRELAERIRKENYKHHDIISRNYGRFSRGGGRHWAARAWLSLASFFLERFFLASGEEKRAERRERKKKRWSLWSGFASATNRMAHL